MPGFGQHFVEHGIGAFGFARIDGRKCAQLIEHRQTGVYLFQFGKDDAVERFGGFVLDVVIGTEYWSFGGAECGCAAELHNPYCTDDEHEQKNEGGYAFAFTRRALGA